MSKNAKKLSVKYTYNLLTNQETIKVQYNKQMQKKATLHRILHKKTKQDQKILMTRISAFFKGHSKGVAQTPSY